MHILLVNDDGIRSPGLRTLAQALKGAGHGVTVVAPDRQRSAVGNGITTRDPLFVRECGWEGMAAYSCSGTPADCTQLGLKACEVPVTRAYPKNQPAPTKIKGMRGNQELMTILLRNLRGAYNPKQVPGAV